MKTTLTIKNLTNRTNGWGMPIIEVKSNTPIKVQNNGWNDFDAIQEIDETDLLKLREYFSGFSNEKVHLEIECPDRITCCWYKLTDVYIGGKGSNIIW